jgi:hypothetical protein
LLPDLRAIEIALRAGGIRPAFCVSCITRMNG